MPQIRALFTPLQQSTGRLLYLTSQAENLPLIRAALDDFSVAAEIVLIDSRADYAVALAEDLFDLVVADETFDGFSPLEALRIACAREPRLPFVCLGSSDRADSAGTWIAAGADDYVSLEHGWKLASAVRLGLRTGANLSEQRRSRHREASMSRLLQAVQELSLARDLISVQAIVRRAARDLTGADGATFVLRDGDRCFYADEDAIGPLWKGQRFPMSDCVSGWVMTHGEPVVIEDIYIDPRIPIEAYRSTFVKSLLMVPIRTDLPVGAIGNYWANKRRASSEDVEILQALANTTAVAMENIGLYARMEQRVKDRTQQLEVANRELETFSYTVSHDLRAPITAILGFAQLLEETIGDSGSPDVRDYCSRIVQQSFRMNGLIQDLLRLSQVAQTELTREPVNLSQMAQDVVGKLLPTASSRKIDVVISPNLSVHADSGLARIMLENLFSNALKYTGKVRAPKIEFGCRTELSKAPVFFVRDNGAGFDPQKAPRLFGAFQRLHEQTEFPGVGVGLATVQRIINKHGGRIWAEGAVGQGATFYFTLPNRGTGTAPPSAI